MGNDTSAKIYSDQRSLPIHLGDSGDGFTLPFKEKWRAPDAIAAVLGFVVTGSLVTANITNGASAFRILILGVVIRDLRNPRRARVSMVEQGATYWHMVDLLWIVLFPLVYVMR